MYSLSFSSGNCDYSRARECENKMAFVILCCSSYFFVFVDLCARIEFIKMLYGRFLSSTKYIVQTHARARPTGTFYMSKHIHH